MYTTSFGRIMNRASRLKVPLEALEALEALELKTYDIFWAA